MSKKNKVSRTSTIEDLREVCFTTLNRLLDETDPMDYHQAKSVAQVGKVLVDAAKLEVSLLKQFGGTGSGFFSIPTTARVLGE